MTGIKRINHAVTVADLESIWTLQQKGCRIFEICKVLRISDPTISTYFHILKAIHNNEPIQAKKNKYSAKLVRAYCDKHKLTFIEPLPAPVQIEIQEPEKEGTLLDMRPASLISEGPIQSDLADSIGQYLEEIAKIEEQRTDLQGKISRCNIELNILGLELIKIYRKIAVSLKGVDHNDQKAADG